MPHLEFSCGCSFPLNGEEISFNPDIESLPLNCVKTWELIGDGNTKGCFQLESRLGQSLSKRTKPKNIDELAALVSIMRPGCMEAMVEGKSLTNHYIDRKHGKESVDYFHPSLQEILKETYGILVFQEQSMQIAQKIANFNLQEADILRKAIGKKKTGEMSKVKKMFLKGAKKSGIVNTEQAEEIFSWIEKSQRYSFNKSHAVSYAVNAYLSAYSKAHFSKEFFTSYLYFSKEKQKPHEEINELVNNARLMNIDVYPPDLRKLNSNFKLSDDNIYFGISDIKGVGTAVIKKIEKEIKEVSLILKKELEVWSWLESLAFFCTRVNSAAMKAMISVGAMSFINSNRTKMLYEYDIVSSFTNKEIEWVRNFLLENEDRKHMDVIDMMNLMLEQPAGRSGAIANKKRLEVVKSIAQSLESRPYELEDGPEWVASKEEFLLGIPVTCTRIDACDTSSANATCRDIVNRNAGDVPLVAVQLDSIRQVQVKNGPSRGEEMAFMSVSDSTCALDCVIFPENWRAYNDLLTEGNTLMLSGTLDKKKESFIVQKAWQI